MYQSLHHPHRNKQNLDNTSIHDMIALLKQYEQMCLDKQDFSSADEAKNKIQFLKSQEIILRKQKLQSEDKENMEIISKQGEEEIRMFQEHWDQHLQELIENLKQVEKSLEEQHQKQLAEFIEKLEQQEVPKMKYSSVVLDLRKHLRNLIKVKNYKQAEIVKIKLENKEKQEVEKWAVKCDEKKKAKLEVLKKKQQTQLNALRVKAQTSFNQSIKERDQKFEILLKKNRKRRIESGKISRERLRTKTALLNESKSYLTINKN